MTAAAFAAVCLGPAQKGEETFVLWLPSSEDATL